MATFENIIKITKTKIYIYFEHFCSFKARELYENDDYIMREAIQFG